METLKWKVETTKRFQSYFLMPIMNFIGFIIQLFLVFEQSESVGFTFYSLDVLLAVLWFIAAMCYTYVSIMHYKYLKKALKKWGNEEMIQLEIPFSQIKSLYHGYGSKVVTYPDRVDNIPPFAVLDNLELLKEQRGNLPFTTYFATNNSRKVSSEMVVGFFIIVIILLSIIFVLL